jgi:NDP-sugar pyrophosphorylase family protein
VKAVILAAGEGKRLGVITNKLPKPMIEINGKPILEHNLDMCKRAGVNDIYINLHHLPDKIRNYFGNGSNYGVNIIYNFEPELLGSSGALLPFQNNLKDNPFFVIYGDNCLSFDLMDIKLFHEKMKADISVLFHWRSDVSNSGIAIFDSKDRINKFIEKPLETDYNSDWVNAGIYYIEANDIFDLINSHDDFGIDTFPKLLIMNYNIFGLKTSADLIAIDTQELLENYLKS